MSELEVLIILFIGGSTGAKLLIIRGSSTPKRGKSTSDDLATAPPATITFVADQLQVTPAALHAHGVRPQTRTGHLGWQFSPRLRDLGDQRLYRIDTSIRYQNIGRLVRGTLKPRLILGHWDDMLRVAGSLKLGRVTASLFIAKFQPFLRQNVLTRAFQEYGRLNKTIFILRYLLDEPYQRRIGAQINKGEALHALSGFLFVANEGKIRRHLGL